MIFKTQKINLFFQIFELNRNPQTISDLLYIFYCILELGKIDTFFKTPIVFKTFKEILEQDYLSVIIKLYFSMLDVDYKSENNKQLTSHLVLLLTNIIMTSKKFDYFKVGNIIFIIIKHFHQGMIFLELYNFSIFKIRS